MPETNGAPTRRSSRRASNRPDNVVSLASELQDIRAVSAAVDEALDTLSAALRSLEVETNRFAQRWQEGVIDTRQIQTIIWAAHVHERLMQEMGGFGQYLQNVHNTPSAWAVPVANWVPEAESLVTDTAKVKSNGDANDRA